MAWKSITNYGEYVSDHYLTSLLKGDLEGLRKRWKTTDEGHPSSAQGVKALGPRFFPQRNDITERLVATTPIDNDPSATRRADPTDTRIAALTDPRIVEQVRALNDIVLTALAFHDPSADGASGGDPTAPAATRWLRRTELEVVHLDQHRQVPVALAVTSAGAPGNLELVALDATWADTCEGIVDADGGSLLLSPIALDGGASIDHAGKAIEFLFGCEDPPRYVLLLAGNVVLLADRSAWPRQYLAVDLAQALHTKDDSPGGELETIAALFGAESLLTHDGQVALAGLVDTGRKHAVSVSKELREALRESVELIAQEILDRIRAQGADPDDLGDNLARRLTEQSLRYLYRILFLLYAEARPELGILPSRDEAYQSGYGLGRLAETVSYDLPEEAEDGLYFHESLNLLFRLVDKGHRARTPDEVVLDDKGDPVALDRAGIRFEALKSDLFHPARTELIGERVRVGPHTVDTRLRNRCLWRVLNLLTLTPEPGSRTAGRGRGSARGRRGQRGFISYAQLGINQLGAVYEGLMSYTGFFAPEDVYEVAKTVKTTGTTADGEDKERPDPSKGTWVVPVNRAADYDDKYFVMRPDPTTGEPKRVVHRKGSFVYRLSGRERQRSASYYTPEVLTQCTVKHALAELLTDDMAARDILDLTVCEPALGSGAFLNEAINQLADAYLDRAQRERGEKLLPDQLEVERQKVKAYLALHNCYGVDLNATAVELAEVSVWLNVMHEKLEAPWFGLHLRRGNSLIGARRAVYTTDQLKRGAWRITPPVDRPMACDRDGQVIDQLADNEIHHFLLPAQGWGAVVDAPQAKELVPDERAALMKWRQQIRTLPADKTTRDRLLALAQRVERLWELTRKRIAISEQEIRRTIDVWGIDPDRPLPQPASGAVTRDEITKALYDDRESPYNRLKTVMDAWCALWFWPVGQGDDIAPPTLDEWLDFCEAVLGVEPPKAKGVKVRGSKRLSGAGHNDRLGLFGAGSNFSRLAAEDSLYRTVFRCQPADRIAIDDRFAWWSVLTNIADREGFFHWELEFAQVFTAGGFDLQIGNPPWLRPEWSEPLFLAEHDPRAALVYSKTTSEYAAIRRDLTVKPSARRDLLLDAATYVGVQSLLNDPALWPTLQGDQTNLYLSFIATTFAHGGQHGVIGLLHQDSHVDGLSRSGIRGICYGRLRRHFAFINQVYLFEDLGNTEEYSINIYGSERSPNFVHVSGLHLVETLEGSFSSDGRDELPGIKLLDGSWDRRPHRERLIQVTPAQLKAWARFQFASKHSDTPPGLLRPVSTFEASVIESIALLRQRCTQLDISTSSGFPETTAKSRKAIVKDTRRPQSLQGVVFQTPFIGICTPFAKEPGPSGRNHRDYAKIDLATIKRNFVPRSNFQIADHEYAEARHRSRERKPMWQEWRVLIREFVDINMERTLVPAIIPPRTSHVHMCRSIMGASVRATVLLAGLLSSMPYDFALRVSGIEHITQEDIERLPLPDESPLLYPLFLRTMRLNCLTDEYSTLWCSMYQECWKADSWAYAPMPGIPLGADAEWNEDTPLRSDFARYRALLEIDVLVALMLNINATDLRKLYRTQFGLMRRYDMGTLVTSDDRMVAAESAPAGARQATAEGNIAKAWRDAELSRGARPKIPEGWFKPDREKEIALAYEEFQRRLAAGEYPDVEHTDVAS